MTLKSRIAIGLAIVLIGTGAIVWFASGGEELATLRGHSGPVRALVVDPTNGLLLSTGDDGTVRAWDLASNRNRTKISAHTKSSGLALGESCVFSVGQDKRLAAWRLPDVSALRELELPVAAECVAASLDGKHVAAGCIDKLIRLWSPPNAQTPRLLKGHTKHVHSVAFAPNGQRLISSGTDGQVRVWDVASGAIVEQFPVGTHHVHGLAVSPDGTQILVAVAGSGLRGWTLGSRDEGKSFDPAAGQAWTVAFSPDAQSFATGHEDGAVRIWDTASRTVRKTYRGHKNVVLSVVFDPTGETVFSASGDSTIKRWRAK